MAKTGSKQPKKPKHVPLRTCIACRETKPKRELLRVVRTPDGHVMIDATGKKSGRGAYLCARLSCWEAALKKKRLEQEFELTLSEEDRLAWTPSLKRFLRMNLSSPHRKHDLLVKKQQMHPGQHRGRYACVNGVYIL